MRRPWSQVLRAWALLVPALARVAVRVLRRQLRRRPPGSGTVSVPTAVGLVSVTVGFLQPILLDQRRIGISSMHDDAGTSTAEIVTRFEPDVVESTARAVVGVAARAAFDRGNHRAAWSAPDDDAVVITTLRSMRFTFEGLAAPPPGEADGWQTWSKLAHEDLDGAAT